jgi:hypothetical protein
MIGAAMEPNKIVTRTLDALYMGLLFRCRPEGDHAESRGGPCARPPWGTHEGCPYELQPLAIWASTLKPARFASTGLLSINH